ncbi:hypothetical protein GGI00_006844, partial [Coemansia sp. RSA 2681]
AAVAAFRRICDSCRAQLAPAAAGMVGLACEVVLAGAAVPPREQQRIAEAVAEVLMALPPPELALALAPLADALAGRLRASLALLEAAPPGLDARAAAPYAAPLAAHLRLAEALARGLQFSDDAEERALQAPDADAAAAMARAAQCYRDSAALAAFRRCLAAVLERVFAARLWQRAPCGGLAEVDDALLEGVLAVVNSTARRSPHVLAMGFGASVAFVAGAWAAVIVRHDGDGDDARHAPAALGPRWADQSPAFLQTITQLVTVSRPDADADADAALAALLSRAVDDVCAAVACDAPSLPVAIEQQP